MVRFNDEINVTAEKKEKMYAHTDKNIQGWGSVSEHCHLQHYIYHTQQRTIITNKSRGKNY